MQSGYPPAPTAVDEFDQCDPDQALSCRIVYDWTTNEPLADLAEWVIGKPLAILWLFFLGYVARWIIHRIIDRTSRRAEAGVLPGSVGRLAMGNASMRAAFGVDTDATRRRVQRARTMGSLLKSITTGVIFAIVLIMAIDELGYNVGPLIASAGILGVALGFGAQTLVRDFLSGIFMILEDQYGVGDVVDVGEANGTVEAVGLRVTRLRDVDGTVWYVRNGEILRVGNMSQNWARTVLDVAVAYDEDLTKVRNILGEVAHGLWEDEDFKGLIIEEPEVWGVQELGPDAVTVRVTLKTAPLEQWAVARAMRERIKNRFDFEGIEIPFPQRVIWQRSQLDPESVIDHDTAPTEGDQGDAGTMKK